ncbi:MAG: histidine phosphatase family protein, partial [Desulfofustis sp.]
GLSWSEIEQDQKTILEEQIDSGWSFRPPGGESRQEVRDRARSALAALGRRYPGEDILVICHQGVIKSLVYAIEERNFKPDEKKLIDKDSLQLLLFGEHGFAAQAYNIVPPEQT